jgi:hypothetical protein
MSFVGFVLFVVLDVLAFFLTLGIADATPRGGRGLVVGAGALILAGIALGGGIALVRLRRPWAKGLGLGLMIGWGLVSIVTAGFCTGVNPTIYTDGW